MPIPPTTPTQPDMNKPVYNQPGPRSSDQQLQTQLGNFFSGAGTGKRLPARSQGQATGTAQPFRFSTQPFTPTQTNTWNWTRPARAPIAPAPQPDLASSGVFSEATPRKLIEMGVTPATAGRRSGEVIQALQERDIPGYFPGAVYSGLRGWYDPGAPNQWTTG